MVIQSFQPNNHKGSVITLPSAMAPVMTLPTAIERPTNSGIGITPPAKPHHYSALKTMPLHQYKGGFRETFSVVGSPYGDQWLSKTTAAVETDAVKVLIAIKALNPASVVCLVLALLPLICFWFAV